MEVFFHFRPGIGGKQKLTSEEHRQFSRILCKILSFAVLKLGFELFCSLTQIANFPNG